MALTISLPDEAERLLRDRAKAVDQPVEVFVEHMIVRALAEPSIGEAAEPIARAVEAMGATDDEFNAAVLAARDAVRRERRWGGE